MAPYFQYDLTEFNNANNYWEMWVALNTLSHGVLTMGFICVIGFVVFVGSKRTEEDFDDALITSSAATALLSLLSWGLQLTKWEFLAFWIAILVMSFIKKGFN